jgi:hypothetical protein
MSALDRERGDVGIDPRTASAFFRHRDRVIADVGNAGIRSREQSKKVFPVVTEPAEDSDPF